MRLNTFKAVVASLLLFSQAVSAETIGVGTTKGGATAQIAAAISKVVSANSEVQVRPQAMANTQQYIPLVNSGKIQLGLANVPQTRFAVSGTGMSEGKPNPDLKMVVTLFTFRTGLMVSEKSGITSVADLKGTKIPAFKDRALGDYIFDAFLESGGLSADDVNGVPASNFPTMWKMFKEGQVDSAIVAVGSKPAYDFDAAMGGVKFIDFGVDNSAIAEKYLPGSFLTETNGGTPGEGDGIHAISFDYALFANKDVPDEIIAAVVKAMYENPEELKKTGPLWKNFDPALMGKTTGVEFHPGAIAFYKEQGIWQE